jgi:hypothetical protein
MIIAPPMSLRGVVKNNDRSQHTQVQLVQATSTSATQEVQPHHISTPGRVHLSTTTGCLCSSIVTRSLVDHRASNHDRYSVK